MCFARASGLPKQESDHRVVHFANKKSKAMAEEFKAKATKVWEKFPVSRFSFALLLMSEGKRRREAAITYSSKEQNSKNI